MQKRTSLETAQLLNKLFNIKFGGKLSGRYQISRKHLLKISGYKVFPNAFLDQLFLDGLDIGFIVIDIGSSYAVIEFSILEGYRNVPPSVIEKILKYIF